MCTKDILVLPIKQKSWYFAGAVMSEVPEKD
jgi:hypothetical protein